MRKQRLGKSTNRSTIGWALVFWGVAMIGCGGSSPGGNNDNDPPPTNVDMVPPDLVSVTATAHQSLLVVFSEALDVATILPAAFHVQGASVAPDVTGALLNGDGLSVTLTITAGMQHGAPYTLLVQGVADVVGNTLQDATLAFTGRGVVVAELSDTPPALTNLKAFSIGVSGVDIVAYQWALTSPSGTGSYSEEMATATPLALADLTDGAYTLSVVGKDSLGNWQGFPEASHASWVVDTVPPVASFTVAPPSIITSRETSFVVAGADVVAFVYALDDAAFGAEVVAGGEEHLTMLAPGAHTLRALGRDLAGNWQPQAEATTHTWVVDDTLPVAALENTPADPTNDSTLAVQVGGSDVVDYRYSLDGSAWSDDIPVATAITATGLAEGSHTLQVRGRDTNGNWQTESTSTSYTWTIDLTPPVAVLSGAPSDPSWLANVTLAVSGADVVMYRFKLDGHPWTGRFDVSTPLALSELAEGLHTLRVAGIDSTGNEQMESPTLHTWNVDLTAPTAVVTLVNPASSPSNSTTLLAHIGGPEVVAYKMSLDGGAWSVELDVAAAAEASGLGEGSHELQVVGRDLAGNWQALASPTRATWQLDLTPPTAVLNGLPALLTNVTTLGADVAGTDVVAYRYRLDGGILGAVMPLATPIAITDLAAGEHVLEVFGSDAVGNWQDTATPYTWTIDLSVPTALLFDLPSDPTSATSVSIGVGGANIDRYLYQWDGGAWNGPALIAASIVASDLPDGLHTLLVRGRNTAGTWQDEVNATTYHWTVDTLAPTAMVSGAPAPLTQLTTATLSVSGAGVVAYRYAVDGGSYGAITGIGTAVELTDLDDGPHSVSVVGVDGAGNWQTEANASTVTWSVDTVAPVAPSTSDVSGSVDGLGVVDNELLLTFTFSPTADVTQVAIQVATDDAFANVVAGGATGIELGAVSTYDYIVDPQHGPRYYARVRVRDAAGNWSPFGAASDGIDVVGGIRGKVKDTNLANVVGATVVLTRTRDGALWPAQTTDANGDFSFANVPIGANAYELEVSADGYLGAHKGNVTVTVNVSADVGLIYLVSSAAVAGRITGTIVDANDGAVLSGANIEVTDWLGDSVVTVTSQANGSFDTGAPDLLPGTYSLHINHLGYFELVVDNIAVDGDHPIGNQALCEILTEPHVRVVLLWGATPRDFDLHVVGPTNQNVTVDGAPNNRFHVYWSGHKSFNENNGTYLAGADPNGTLSTTSLVQDDTSGYGPEAINLFGYGSGYALGVNTFTVHKYSSTGTWYDFPMTMRVYDSEGMVREIPLPSGAGSYRYWQAIKINIAGAGRSNRTLSVVNSFASLNYASKSSLNW